MNRKMVCDKKSLLQYFGIKEKDYSLGDKKVKLVIPESRRCYEDVPEHLLQLLHTFKIDTENYLKILKIYENNEH
jgi:hypothetical protein